MNWEMHFGLSSALRHSSMVGRLLMSATTAMILMLVSVSRAQNSQFLFDGTGNLAAQTGEIAAAPQILGQPQNQIVIPGKSASFSVVVADTRGVSYQWYSNSAAISGATGDALLLTNVGPNDEGPFSVTVSNSAGPVASSPAFLYIDANGNGLPDSWEIAHFGNLNQTATGDPDGDGVDNLQEFLDGTDPNSAASVLYRITLLNDGGTVVAVPDQTAYTNGQVVTLTATGSSAAPFHAWTGDVVTRTNSITVTMNSNMSLFAHFLPFNLNWTNTASGDWNVGANWTPNLVPGSNESVVIVTVNPVQVTLNSNVDLLDFTLGSASSGPELTGSGRLTIAGTGQWLAGTMSGSGSTVVLPGASFNIANATTINLNGRTFENQAVTTWVSGGNINDNGGVFTNDAGAQFQVAKPGSFTYGSGVPRFDNAGTLLTANIGTTAFPGVAFNNYGTVNIQGGTLSMSGGGVNAGTVTVPAGMTVNFAGGTFTSSGNPSITGAGTLLFSGGNETLGGTINVTGSNIFNNAYADFTGNYTCTNNTMVINGGSASFDGTGMVSPNVLNLFGTLGGAQNVSVVSAMNWTGGTMNGTGRTIIPPGATLTIANPAFMTINNRTLDNGGTTLWTGAANINVNDAVITNRVGALFNVQNDSPLYVDGGAPRFDNAGTFRKSLSAGTTTLGVSFNNYGTVDIQGGTLTLGGGGTHTGTMTVPAGAAINLAGVFNSTGGSSITGAGQLMIGGGTVTLGGTVNLGGTNVFNGGSVDFTGNYTCTNNTMAFNNGATASFDGTGMVSPNLLNLFGTLGGAQNVTVGSAMNWTGGAMTGTGRTIIQPGATLTASAPSLIAITDRTLDNGGTTLWSALNLSLNAGVITNEAGALFQIQTPSAINTSGGSPRFDNSGTLRTTGSGTATLGVSFNNLNLVDIQGGTLTLGGGGTLAGIMTVPLGTTINFAGGTFTSGGGSSITGAGTLQFSSGTSTLGGTVNLGGTNVFNGGSVDFTGNYICTNNTMVFNNGATASFDGTGIISPNLLNLFGTLGGAQNVSVVSAMNWTGGAMTGTGRTIIPPGATLTINNPSLVSMTSRTLDNAGTTVWTGAASLSLNAAVITNRVGGLFNLQNASPISFGGGAPRFDNAGTFRKSVSTGTTTIGISFTNYGTVDLQSGFLSAGSGYGSTSNSVLNCALAGTTPGINYGQLKVSGSVTLNGTLSVNLTNYYVPATNSSFTVVSAGTRNGAFANFIYPSNNVSMLLSNTTTSVIARVTGVSLQPTNAFPAPPGIISWWRAENNALDAVGTNNGVLTNGTAFAAGEVGQSFLLDGIDDYVVIPDSTSLRPASVTVEAWVKVFSTNGTQLVFAKPLGSASLDSYGLALVNGEPLAAVCDTNGFGTFISSTNPLALGQWYHLAYTYDGTSSQEVLYVNGGTVASANAGKSMNFDAHPLLLGADIENGVPAYFLNGQIDEASIYNRALTAGEIASIYNVGSIGKQLVSANPLVLHLESITPTTARLYWSTNYPGYHLEYNTTLQTNTWAASGLTTLITGTNFMATNTLSGPQKFYRLSSVSPPYVPAPPALTIQLMSTNMVQLLWAVDEDQPFQLQSTLNLTSANWTSVSPSPSILGANNVVTNAIGGAQKFYRLFKP